MSSPSVLLIDDGELDDVRTLLAQMGANFVHLRGGQVTSDVEQPAELFIATTRRALLAEAWPVGPVSSGPRKIAVVTEDSNTLRNRLRRAGFEMEVQRPGRGGLRHAVYLARAAGGSGGAGTRR